MLKQQRTQHMLLIDFDHSAALTCLAAQTEYKLLERVVHYGNSLSRHEHSRSDGEQDLQVQLERASQKENASEVAA